MYHSKMAGMISRLQFFLPKRTLTRVAGRIANKKAGRVIRSLVRGFVRRYSVNMREARNADISSYQTFNEFFSRALRTGTRPIASTEFISPVDGVVSQFGNIDANSLVQAKGHRYTTTSLLAGNDILAKTFEHGSYATFYLSPRDYHRVHMPCDGRLLRMWYVPGSFFSVNPKTANSIDNLFTRNERVICTFDTEMGLLAVVFVGATIVGSVATVWHGVVRPKRRRLAEWGYEKERLTIAKGAELGRFLLGSTVILLCAVRSDNFNPAWYPGKRVSLGEALAGLHSTEEGKALWIALQVHGFLFGDAFDKVLTFKMGQTNVQRYMPELLENNSVGKPTPDVIISHRMSLAEAERGYELFDEKQEECRKVVLTPGG
jgi:phosphatidylserine decarboxylase